MTEYTLSNDGDAFSPPAQLSASSLKYLSRSASCICRRTLFLVSSECLKACATRVAIRSWLLTTVSLPSSTNWPVMGRGGHLNSRSIIERTSMNGSSSGHAKPAILKGKEASAGTVKHEIVFFY
jgi:hypothetical protein